MSISVVKDMTIQGAMVRGSVFGRSQVMSMVKRGLMNQSQKLAKPSIMPRVISLPILKNSPISLYPFLTNLMIVNIRPKKIGTRRSMPKVSPGNTT